MSDYISFKNHLHNTLGITKASIRTMVEKAVYKVVERKVEVMLRDKWTVDRLVDDAISRKITQNNWFWGESEDKLDDYVKKEVVNRLTDGVKLKVEVATRAKDATLGRPKIRLRKRRIAATYQEKP